MHRGSCWGCSRGEGLHIDQTRCFFSVYAGSYLLVSQDRLAERSGQDPVQHCFRPCVEDLL